MLVIDKFANMININEIVTAISINVSNVRS